MKASYIKYISKYIFDFRAAKRRALFAPLFDFSASFRELVVANRTVLEPGFNGERSGPSSKVAMQLSDQESEQFGELKYILMKVYFHVTILAY